MDENLRDKYFRLKNHLGQMGSILVAYSGGTDSTLVLAVAKEALKDNVVAVTVHSPLQSKRMLNNAATMASRIRAEHITVNINEIAGGEFANNPPERCYLCKHQRFLELIEIANREGLDEVVDGTNVDDTSEYRPGLEAAAELGIRSPLLEIGFAKYEVRALSRELGLSTWNLPPATCLATRVPFYEPITLEKLSIIEQGEEFLTEEIGLGIVRLRFVEDRVARIEVPPSSISHLVSDGIRERVLRKMKQLGFIYTTVDIAGYRSGSLNEPLELR